MPYPIGYHHIIMPLSCHHHYHICPTLYTCLCAYVLGEEKNLTPQHDIFQGGIMSSSLSSSLSFCVIILLSSSYDPHPPYYDPHPPYNKEEVTYKGGYYREPIIGVPPSLRRTGNPKKGVIIIREEKHISGKV